SVPRSATNNLISDAPTLMSPAEIYDQAVRQAVGIRTEVTMTNFFGMTSSGAVSGSGFIISEDGYILTNYHVVESAHTANLDIKVVTFDGTEYIADIVGVEPNNDIAVLKINAQGLSAAGLGNSDELRVGDAVYAVGNPLGELDFSMSTGHVSALDRVINTQESERINMFQIDAAVNEGNSGGPVYNGMGEVVGIVTAKYSSSGVEGLGFAIPINDVKAIADDLINIGYVTGKAYMGVSFDSRYNSMYSQYYGMPLGAYVGEVTPHTAAEKAGLKSGDIITAIGGYTVESYNDIKGALRHFSSGETAVLTVYRAGDELHLSITFDEAKPDT
ncbi:MAG: trypsin-like peptidase domain-containing protein, partial [Oscillospiraceae bacterium]|nr:trypsin-like peptidase domain-containing protein [Oscillospiraceae bacterium]